MKRIALPLILLAICIFLPVLQAVAAEPEGAETAFGMAVVNNPDGQDRLNLREAPDTDAASLGRYYNGTAVACLSDWTDDSTPWVRVSVGSLTGYMLKAYLSFDGALDAIPSAQPRMVVNNENPSSWLNLREEASQTSRVLGQFFNGKEVTVLGDCGDWLHVSVDGVIGFMMPRFLKAQEQASVQMAEKPAPERPREYAVYQVMDQGYSISASAREVDPGVFNVDATIAFAPDYTTNDDIASYALYIDGVWKADLNAYWGAGNMLLAPTTFAAQVRVAEDFSALQLVPVLEKGGEYPAGAVVLSEMGR